MCKQINPVMFDISSIGDECGIYNDDEFIWPPVTRLAYQCIESCRLCLLDDGFSLYLYIIE